MVRSEQASHLTSRIVFTSDVSENLRRLLEGQEEPAKPDRDGAAPLSTQHKNTQAIEHDRLSESTGNFKTSGFKSSFKVATEPITDPAERLLQEVLGENAEQEEQPDLDGEEMEIIDGMDDEDMDGEAMEDLDGEAM